MVYDPSRHEYFCPRCGLVEEAPPITEIPVSSKRSELAINTYIRAHGSISGAPSRRLARVQKRVTASYMREKGVKDLEAAVSEVKRIAGSVGLSPLQTEEALALFLRAVRIKDLRRSHLSMEALAAASVYYIIKRDWTNPNFMTAVKWAKADKRDVGIAVKHLYALFGRPDEGLKNK